MNAIFLRTFFFSQQARWNVGCCALEGELKLPLKCVHIDRFLSLREKKLIKVRAEAFNEGWKREKNVHSNERNMFSIIRWQLPLFCLRWEEVSYRNCWKFLNKLSWMDKGWWEGNQRRFEWIFGNRLICSQTSELYLFKESSFLSGLANIENLINIHFCSKLSLVNAQSNDIKFISTCKSNLPK